MNYIGNAMSLGMLSGDSLIDAKFITFDEAKNWVISNNPQSCVGHEDTALLLTAMLGTEVKMRRVSTELLDGDKLLVAQYNGPRLPEGAASLPEGAKIRWVLVTIKM